MSARIPAGKRNSRTKLSALLPMNPDFPQTPREELEARLTALLLGELPAEEAAALRAQLAQDPELAALHKRLEQTIGLVREVSVRQGEPATAQTAPLKLSEERREKLLAEFKTIKPQPLLPPLTRRQTWLVPVAAAAILLLLAAITLPNFIRARNTSASNAMVNNLRQIEAAKQQWALEHGKSPSDVPTIEDIKDYIKGGLPASVVGETYVLGPVGLQPTVESAEAQPRTWFFRRSAQSPQLQSITTVATADASKQDARERAYREHTITTHLDLPRGGMAERYDHQGTARRPSAQIVLPTPAEPETEVTASAARGASELGLQFGTWAGGGRPGSVAEGRKAGEAVVAQGVSDREWAGVLEQPALPHSTDNRFVARYDSLQVRGVSPTTGLPPSAAGILPELAAEGKAAAGTPLAWADYDSDGALDLFKNAGQPAAGAEADAFRRRYGLEATPSEGSVRGRFTESVDRKVAPLPALAPAPPSQQTVAGIAGAAPADATVEMVSPQPGYPAIDEFSLARKSLAKPDADKVPVLGDLPALGGALRVERPTVETRSGRVSGPEPVASAAQPEPSGTQANEVVSFDDPGQAVLQASTARGIPLTSMLPIPRVNVAGAASLPIPGSPTPQDLYSAEVVGYAAVPVESSVVALEAAKQPLRRSQSSIVLPPTSAGAGVLNAGVARAGDALQDARVLMESGKAAAAEVKLREVLQSEPDNRAAGYYLNLAREQQQADPRNLGEERPKKGVTQIALGDQASSVLQRDSEAKRELERMDRYWQKPPTNLVRTGGSRQIIASKLNGIRLESLNLNGVTLGEVVQVLNEEAKKRDPEKKGIHFILNPNLPATLAPVDIGSLAVTTGRTLRDVRLTDVLDAIVKSADQPIKYSIEDYAVVFSRVDAAADADLVTRTYKLDPSKFYQGLESVGALVVTPTNSMDALQNGVLNFYTTLGVDLQPAVKAVLWNDRTGTLLVRATPNDLEVIEFAHQAFGATTAVEQDVSASRKPATNAPIPQPEIQTTENAFSTFSLNVSDVAFKLASASLEQGQMPDPASVRAEEFLNAFDYRDPEPPPGMPIAFAWERARYPFAHNRDLLRFSLKTGAAGRQAGRPLNLVLLLDNSGSMERADRVQIIRESLRVLAGQLQPQDKLSVISFARTARLVADGLAGDKAGEVLDQVSGLTPQGGTNLEEAMNLAYATALRHYLASGLNRIVLLTDGAANLGNVEPESLKHAVETHRKQGVALDCFGIGWEGLNDDLLEVLSRNGDGRYGFINSPTEAATEFAAQLAGALQVAASDVKVQVEFNPKRVTAYRQIGYAKHQLTKEQFRDNTVDAAEIAAREAGNALYTVAVNHAGEGPLGTVRVRFKIPGTTDYREHEWPVPYTGSAVSLEQASAAMRLAASASAFAEWLVVSPFAAEVTPDALLGYLSGVPEVYGADARPKKLEWMIRQAKSLAGK
jgi:Mg-chelatase subunit ChlD/type II secretory pathway pseudopilin PulG